MDVQNLSEADKYLLYGLLLKRQRSAALDRKVLAIARSGRDLDAKITAIMALQEPGLAEKPGRSGTRRKRGPAPGKAKRRQSALVVDVYPEVTRLLNKCSLKRTLSFTRVGESLDGLFLLKKLGVRLIILNEPLPAEEYARYYEICRVIEPRVRIVFLSSPPGPGGGSADFRRSTRFLPKPLNIDLLDRTVRDLLNL
jgi:hypothetical protein